MYCLDFITMSDGIGVLDRLKKNGKGVVFRPQVFEGGINGELQWYKDIASSWKGGDLFVEGSPHAIVHINAAKGITPETSLKTETLLTYEKAHLIYLYSDPYGTAKKTDQDPAGLKKISDQYWQLYMHLAAKKRRNTYIF